MFGGMRDAPRRVVVTGAAGSIGRAVSPLLAPRWDLQLTDVASGSAAVLDVTDVDACRGAFKGAGCVSCGLLIDIGGCAAYRIFAASPPAGSDAPARDLAAWLSPRDCAELVRAAVEAEGIRFAVANGISANRYRIADPSETMQLLGYHLSRTLGLTGSRSSCGLTVTIGSGR